MSENLKDEIVVKLIVNIEEEIMEYDRIECDGDYKTKTKSKTKRTRINHKMKQIKDFKFVWAVLVFYPQ